MNGRWRFRRARPEDLDRLHAVWLASVSATHGFLTPADLDALSVQVRHDYLPNAVLLAAVDGQERVVGFMGLNGAEIEALFLDPAWRGRGLGQAFVEHAQASAPGLALEVAVNEQNPQAVGFYEALGFSTYARTPLDGDGRPFPLLHMRRPAP